jgi:hypothetical protein
MRKKLLVRKADLTIDYPASLRRTTAFRQLDITDISRLLRSFLSNGHFDFWFLRLLGDHFLDLEIAGRERLGRLDIFRFPQDLLLSRSQIFSKDDPTRLLDFTDPVLTTSGSQGLAGRVNLPGHLAPGGIAEATRVAGLIAQPKNVFRLRIGGGLGLLRRRRTAEDENERKY